LMSMSPRP